MDGFTCNSYSQHEMPEGEWTDADARVATSEDFRYVALGLSLGKLTMFNSKRPGGLQKKDLQTLPGHEIFQ